MQRLAQTQCFIEIHPEAIGLNDADVEHLARLDDRGREEPTRRSGSHVNRQAWPQLPKAPDHLARPDRMTEAVAGNVVKN